MNLNPLVGAIVAALLTAVWMDSSASAGSDAMAPPPTRVVPVLSGTAFEAAIARWPKRPQLAARQMVARHGPPQEATAEALVWRDVAPFKRITVTRLETPHDFPWPHMDFLEHTVAFNVPAGKVYELAAFDGSLTVGRTEGELSARCDLEGHNLLTLNLASDVVLGKRSAQEARKAFGLILVEDVLGKHPLYLEKLLLEPSKDAAFADAPGIPGAPVRGPGKSGGDAELLALLIAVDANEVDAAAEAEARLTSGPVLDFARTMHAEHGQNLVDTMALAQRLTVAPAQTAAADALRVSGAGDLAGLLKLGGKDFERGFLSAMVDGHTEVLKLFDAQLLKSAKNEALREHFTRTRVHVAMHLERAQALVREPRAER